MSKAPALSRPMDWSYRSNVFIVAATPLIGAVAGLAALLASESLTEAFWWGYFAAGASFLAWTIARELHPDRVWIATVATFLAPLGLVWGRGDLLASATVLLVVRAVAGTTGRSLRVADLVLLAAVGGPLVVRPAGPGALAVGAIGLALTIVWHSHRRGVHVAATGLYAIGSVTAVVVGDGLAVSGDGAALLWIGVAAGLVTLVGPGIVAAGTDRAGGAIQPVRVRVARAVALVTAIVVAVTHDPAAMAPVWAALAATALRPR